MGTKRLLALAKITSAPRLPICCSLALGATIAGRQLTVNGSRAGQQLGGPIVS